MTKARNVFEAILKYGHDEDFAPAESNEFEPTDAPAGSAEKIEILRNRVEQGLPLWHNEDRHDYAGLTGAGRPRE
jgi:hypothetical protein